MLSLNVHAPVVYSYLDILMWLHKCTYVYKLQDTDGFAYLYTELHCYLMDVVTSELSKRAVLSYAIKPILFYYYGYIYLLCINYV
jgi:hypothetical protein